MEILKIRSSKLRNGEHIQFHTEVERLINRVEVTIIKIEEQYANYKLGLTNESTALKLIRKNGTTAEIEEIDSEIGSIFSGLVLNVKSSQKHFNADIKKAADNVMIVFNTYGNISALSYEEQTSSAKSLISDLNEKYAPEIATLSLAPWITELNNKNLEFEALIEKRYTEESGKTSLRMATIRKEVDALYGKIIKRLDALMEVNGDADYIEFIKELNIHISHYNNVIARREGHNSNNEDESDEPKTE